jgi:hypothetical protein
MDHRGSYRIELLHTIDDIDNDNIDVVVEFESGERYSATFFTLASIQERMNHFAKTGECSSGTYFWASDLIVVRQLTPETVSRTVSDLIEQNQLGEAFLHLERRTDGA